jgi:peptidoglycan-N-acetylglucosamine deacetylase
MTMPHRQPVRTIVVAPPSPEVRTPLTIEAGECVLTFDDGPVLPASDAVLRALRAAGVPAVFFLVGFNAARLPALVARMVADGHTIGSHTDIHLHLADVSIEDQLAEVAAGFEAVAQAVGEPHVAPFFRFPYLAETPALVPLLARAGVTVWDADVDAADWRGITVPRLIERAIDGLRRQNGGILLALIDAIDAAGFRFVRVVGSPGWSVGQLRQVCVGAER